MKPDNLLSSAGETFEYARLLITQQRDYLQLEMAKRLAKTTSKLMTLVVTSFFMMMVVLFLSIAIGLLLGQYWNSYGLAFLCLTAGYLLIAILVLIFRKQIITNPILSTIIKELTD